MNVNKDKFIISYEANIALKRDATGLTVKLDKTNIAPEDISTRYDITNDKQTY